jgi:hypothetical protein
MLVVLVVDLWISCFVDRLLCGVGKQLFALGGTMSLQEGSNKLEEYFATFY